jgi:hypothetical protein
MLEGKMKDGLNINGASDNAEDTFIVEKIEDAYKVFKISEVFLKDVKDDYGKLKIARLRLEFARHELLILLDEAREKGIKLNNNELIKGFFYK